MVFTVISPLAGLSITGPDIWFGDYTDTADLIASEGERYSVEAMAAVIKSRTEAYILDKGTQLGVSLDVQVELSQDPIPVPVRVRLKGNVSPYAKSRLQQILAKELGISKGDQIWT